MELKLSDASPEDLKRPQDKKARTVTIIGLGNLGGRVARHLAHWGIPQLVLWDGDVVDAHNVRGWTSQIYKHSQIGQPKTKALAKILKEINPAIKIKQVNRWIEGPEKLSGIVIAGLDDFDARVAVRDSCLQSPKVSILIEGRLGDNFGRVFALDPQNFLHQDRYLEDEKWKPFGEPEPYEMVCGGSPTAMLLAELCAITMTNRLWGRLIRERGENYPVPNDEAFQMEPVISTEGVIWGS